MQLNRKALTAALDDYADNLRAMADVIEQGDEGKGLALIQAAVAKRQRAQRLQDES